MEGILVPISLFLGAFAMVFGIRLFSNKEEMNRSKGEPIRVYIRPHQNVFKFKVRFTFALV